MDVLHGTFSKDGWFVNRYDTMHEKAHQRQARSPNSRSNLGCGRADFFGDPGKGAIEAEKRLHQP
jgi:hypothetical protein